VLAGPLHPYTPHTVTDPRQLRRVLADVRRTGVAISDRQVTMDAVSVAAPIEVGGEVIAALSIVVRGSSPAAVRAMTPGVCTAARGISRTLSRAGGLPPSARRKSGLSDGSVPTYRAPLPVDDRASRRALRKT
jgi:hypothetical protein